MGRQISFYMLPEDFDAYEKQLQKEDICFVLSKSQKNEILVTDSMYDSCKRGHGGRFYLARRSDLDRIAMTEIMDGKAWMVDQLSSYAVEFDIPFYDGTVARNGRLYFITEYWMSNTLVRKDDDFVKWADKILRWIRNHYKKAPNYFAYIAPYAREWWQDGGTLQTNSGRHLAKIHDS